MHHCYLLSTCRKDCRFLGQKTHLPKYAAGCRNSNPVPVIPSTSFDLLSLLLLLLPAIAATFTTARIPQEVCLGRSENDALVSQKLRGMLGANFRESQVPLEGLGCRAQGLEHGPQCNCLFLCVYIYIQSVYCNIWIHVCVCYLWQHQEHLTSNL